MSGINYVAVDFDGTLCSVAFPEIGEQLLGHKRIMDYCNNLKRKGVTLILWTCREDNEERAYLTEAVKWCKDRGLEFDYINENPECTYGYPPGRKINADLYIDDKAMNAAQYFSLETYNET